MRQISLVVVVAAAVSDNDDDDGGTVQHQPWKHLYLVVETAVSGIRERRNSRPELTGALRPPQITGNLDLLVFAHWLGITSAVVSVIYSIRRERESERRRETEGERERAPGA